MIKRFVLMLILLAYAETAQEIPRKFNVFKFRFQNDFVFGTDRYFTNGFDFSFSSSDFSALPVNNLLFPESENISGAYAINLVQEIFTPQEKDSIKPVIGDRPFSANLYLTYSRKNFIKSRGEVLEFRFLLGIMGPYALGEEVQNGIHSLLPPSGEVLGWENQLSTSPLISYGIRYFKTVARSCCVKVKTEAAFEIGQPNTRGEVGLSFTVGEDYLNYVLPENFKWNFIFRVRTFLVAYNSNLQGGLFTDNVYSIDAKDVKRVVLNLNSEFNFAYRKIEFAVGANLLTPEFKRGKSHLWFFTEVGYKF